jgi:hypothetical protein
MVPGGMGFNQAVLKDTTVSLMATGIFSITCLSGRSRYVIRLGCFKNEIDLSQQIFSRSSVSIIPAILFLQK